MITAQELRQGNLFFPINRHHKVNLPDNVPFRICVIDFFFVRATLMDNNPALEGNLYEYPYADLSPIPLTKEWLLRFGFDRCPVKINGYSTFEDSRKSNFMRGYLYFDNEKRGFEWYISALNDIEIYPLISALAYVHQLQNLYYNLTGTELTIKQEAQ